MMQEQKTIAGSGTYTTEWGYNSADMVAWMKYPEGNTGAVGEQVNFDYYPQLALKRVVGVGTATYLDEAAYNEMGRMVTRKLGSSLPETTYTYYPATTQGGRLMNTITGSLQNLAYTYDPNGNILSIADGRSGGDAPLTFGYDAANRLDWMNINGVTSDDPAYDANGRLIQKGTSTAISYNSAGHINAASSMGNNSYSYDANGNMRTRPGPGGTNYLKFDAENRLVSISLQQDNSNPFATFVYDGDGKRVKGTVNGVTTTYVGNYYEVQGTTTRKYYFAGTQRIAVRENSTLYFFLSDHLGSTAITVEEDGDFHGELRYSAWGETREDIGDTPTSRRFTGQAQEELLGIYFFEARWFDPGPGRFLSPDSVVPDPYNSLDWDRYAFVRGNPINFVDPSGHAGGRSEKYLFDSGEYATPIEQVLKSFGITINGGSSSQVAAVLGAALKIGEKLDSLMGWVASSSDAFKSVMGGTTVTFAGEGNGCNASGGNGFVCGTSTWSDPRLYAHEYGHTFSSEHSLRPYTSLDIAAVYDTNGNWVFGTLNGTYNRTTLGYRGESYPWMYHGKSKKSPDWNVGIVGRNEDYADMFMNWAYDSFDYSTESGGAGQVRYNWMNVNIAYFVGGR